MQCYEENKLMISKRQEADRQFLKISRKEKVERTNSKSRTITDADKTTRDLKTASLRKQREAKEAGEPGEVGEGSKKGKRDRSRSRASPTLPIG